MPHKRAKAVGKILLFDNKTTPRSIDRFGFNPNRSLESLPDFVRLMSSADVGKRTKAGRKYNDNNKSKQMRSNDRFGFNIKMLFRLFLEVF